VILRPHAIGKIVHHFYEDGELFSFREIILKVFLIVVVVALSIFEGAF
jgi:hypothetical protein